MVEPDNLVLVHLREMRADMAAQFETLKNEMNARFAAVDGRLDKIERRLEMMHSNGVKAFGQFIGHRGNGGAEHRELSGRLACA